MQSSDRRKMQSLARHSAVGVSRYLQLAILFRRNIASGVWKLRQQIPTVEQLAESHGVARATVRQALGILADEKLIERFRAKGTFVIQHPQERLWCEVHTDWSGLLLSREGGEIELLSERKNVQPAPSVLHPYKSLAESYRHFRRRHSRRNEPYLLADVYIDERLCKQISRSDLKTKTSLNILANIRGLKLGDVRQTLTIGAADLETADKLEMPLNAAVAYVHRSAIDEDGCMIFVADGTYRGDFVRLDIKLR
jgi:GntR family transcriptional regulator